MRCATVIAVIRTQVAVSMALVWLLVAAAGAQASGLELPVPRTTIYPGDIISNDQIYERAFVEHTVARATVFDGRQAVVGKVARRTLLPGQPIPVNSVREPFLVVQGKTALAVYESGGLSIMTQALALQNGGLGDVVTLRNLDSGTVIRGTVTNDGSVRIGGP